MADQNLLLALDIGNSRTAIGAFHGSELAHHESFNNEDLAAIVERAVAWWAEASDASARSIVVAHVNAPVAEQIRSAIEDQLGEEVYRISDDLPIPVGTQLDPETMTGQDRLLNAAAAFDMFKQACIIVDAGTALTVDFVDGEGTFHGGAIAPGASMQLHMLNSETVALPDIPFAAPEGEAFGRSTTEAMIRGVYHGIRGAVQRLVETYATSYGAFPMVIATGGDAEVLFGSDELIDRVIPNLTLQGIAVAARHALKTDDADSEPGIDIDIRPDS